MNPPQIRLGMSQGHVGTTGTLLEGARLFARALEVRIGQPVRVQVTESYAALLKLVVGGAVEVSWMPPFLHLTVTRDARHALAAVCERNGALTYRSAIFGRLDGEIRSIADLARTPARMAWTDPSSAAGHVFPRMHLVDAGLDPAQAFASERFYGSPRAACAAVADGHADLCACFTSERSAAHPDQIMTEMGRVYVAAPWRLRVLAVTESIPADGIVISPHVDAERRQRITDALLSFHSHLEGRSALDELLFADRLARVTPEVTRIMDRLRGHMPP